jgi:hypothetical protein
MTSQDLNYPEKYYRDIQLSEEFVYLRENFFEKLAENFRKAFNLDNYIQICQTVNIAYGHDWLDLDEVERRAFEISVNKINIERHKANQQEKEDLKKQFEASKPHRSSFSDISMPSLKMT